MERPVPVPPPRRVFVRDAGKDDLELIIAFNRGLAEETESKRLDEAILRRGVAQALRDPDRLRYWVAVDSQSRAVIGQAAITREWSDWRNGWIWWFQSVYVVPEHRGRGVFRALHSSIRDQARESPDVVGLRLYVEEQNDRAMKTYQSLGMSPGGYHVFEEIWPDRGLGAESD
ncbi:MAG: GNAT family N-acetyltransferase [Isosphaeraceae bacterium]